MAQSQVIFCCVVLALALSIESVAAGKGKGLPMIASEAKCFDKCSMQCEPVETEVCKDVPKVSMECKDVPVKQTTQKCKTVCETPEVTTTTTAVAAEAGKGKGIAMPVLTKGKGRKLQHLIKKHPMLFGKGKAVAPAATCTNVCKDETVEVMKKACKTVMTTEKMCMKKTTMDCKKVCAPKCISVPVLVKPTLVVSKAVVVSADIGKGKGAVAMPVMGKGKGL